MPRYIDAEKLKKELFERKDAANEWYADAKIKDDEEMMVRADAVVAAFIECILTINSLPTADVVERKELDTITEAHEQIGYEKGYRDGYAQANVVEVVRCKECVHLEILNGSTYYARCNWHGRLFDSFGRVDTRTWFCADGERSEDE